MRPRLFTGSQWVAGLALLAAAAWLALIGLPDGKLHVYFLDVGQGDAILIVAPDGRQILVDGGPSPTALFNELSAVLPFWDRSLDLVVLTHPDKDHLDGLVPLFERYRVAQVLDVPQSDAAPDAAAWRDALRRAAVPRRYAQRGSTIPVGKLVLTVLHPGPQPLAGDNDNSAVLRLDYGRTSLLLAADAGFAAEAQMLDAGMSVAADVLKVGHHGGGTSSSPAFLSAVRPRWAVIQVGAGNLFGHPEAAVLERLAGSQVLRTDLNGRIEAVSDGAELRVRAER